MIHPVEKALQNVVVVGGANVDIIGQAQQTLAPGDSTPGQVATSRGGVGRNVAENLARLGLATRFYSAVGQDEWGDRLCRETQAQGVDVVGVMRSASLPSAHYLSLVQTDGSVYAALNDMRVLEQLTPEGLHAQGFDLRAAHALVLDCNLRADTLAWVLDAAQAYPAMPVVVDAVSAAKCHKINPHLAQIHLLKLNPLEARALTGLAVHSIAEAQEAAHGLWRKGVRHTLLSLGAQGVCWCDEAGQVGHAAARPVQLVNTNGAGDALLAGVVYGLMAMLSWPQSVQFGLACAALTLQVAGANADNLTRQAVTEACQDDWLGENKTHET